MFLGQADHNLDAKGRLIVPAKFREQLTGKFIISSGFDGCLYIYPEEAWMEFDAKLESLPKSKPEARKIVRFFRANAEYAELDKQGRVLIPEKHRKYAKIDKEVTLIGDSKRIEVWSSEVYYETNAITSEKLDELTGALTTETEFVF